MTSIDAKLVRFFQFIEKAAERYCVPKSVLSSMGLDTEEMLKSQKARTMFLEASLPLFIQSSPDVAARVCALRDCFEHMSEKDREAVIENDLLPMCRDFAAKVQATLLFLEENKHQLSADMRTLGAYLSMFTESYLDNTRSKRKQRTAETE